VSENLENKKEDEFKSDVGTKEQRKLLARRGGKRSTWFWLGMMGLVGWTVSIPTLIGVAVGVWLDRTIGGRISWTLTCLVLGIVTGAITAWYWVSKESMEH
jgi:ATP synthase protein I